MCLVVIFSHNISQQLEILPINVILSSVSYGSLLFLPLYIHNLSLRAITFSLRQISQLYIKIHNHTVFSAYIISRKKNSGDVLSFNAKPNIPLSDITELYVFSCHIYITIYIYARERNGDDLNRRVHRPGPIVAKMSSVCSMQRPSIDSIYTSDTSAIRYSATTFFRL